MQNAEVKKSISESILHLAEYSAGINEKAAKATKQIKSVSDALLAIQCAVTGYFGRHLSGGSGCCTVKMGKKTEYCSYELGFGRDDDGNMGIVIRCSAQLTNNEGRPLPSEVVIDEQGNREQETQVVWVRPAISCSRDLRIKAASMLEELVIHLDEQTEGLLEGWHNPDLLSDAKIDEVLAAIASGPAEEVKF